MSQRQDTLTRARKHARQLEAQNRKMLKRRMNEYNVLSRAGAGFHDSDGSSPDTIHDISQQLQNTLSRASHSTRVCSTRSEERLLSRVISQEVKEVWLAKLSLHQSLDDVSRAKLVAQSRNTVDPNKTQVDVSRELRLNALARAFVLMWTETEGFDPDKIRPKLLRRIKYNESQRLF